MARKKSTSTALAKYEDALAAAAKAAAEQEANTGGGQFFSIRNAVLKLNDNPLPNNEMAVVIVDGVIENVFYADDFDSDNPATPVCYAFGRSDDGMVPHAESSEKQHDQCATCPNNQFGTADRGKGKACKNRRRLALLSAGTLDQRSGDFTRHDDPEMFSKGPIAYLNLPPTALNAYGAYVKQIANTLKRPPWAVFTRISVSDDEKTQIRLSFELLDNVPTELIPTLMKRNEDERSVIEFPYRAVDASQAKPGKTRRSKKTTTKRAPRKTRNPRATAGAANGKF